MGKKLIIDPEFQALIPPLTTEEVEALEQNIQEHGCRDSIVVWGNIIVDGHNRYKICEKHGLPYRTVELERIDTRESVLCWMINNQLARRNLPDFQRVFLAKQREGVHAALAQERQKAGTNQYSDPSTNLSKGSPLNTRRAIATSAGVSEGTVGKVTFIEEHGAPILIEKVRAGEIKIDVAAKVATLPEEEQVALVSAGTGALKAAAATVRKKQKAKRQTKVDVETPESMEGTSASPCSPGATDDEIALLRAEIVSLKAHIVELTDAQLRAGEAVDIAVVDTENEAAIQLVAAEAEIARLTALNDELQARIESLVAEKNGTVTLEEA